MADALNPILSVISTTASRLPDLAIKDGQLIFVKDTQKVALDIGSRRTFYNQINILQTESERQSLLAPISGLFYFVLETKYSLDISNGVGSNNHPTNPNQRTFSN